ncbi:MAG: NAD(P)H-hydrate dehydratase [Planctomycetales bacterium]
MTDRAPHELSLTPLPASPPRKPDGHKGDFGRGLIVGGSQGMSGAAVLAGRALLRGGVGLGFLAVPEGIQAIVAAAEPSYLTVSLQADAEGRVSGDSRNRIVEQASRSDAIGYGPGMGQSPGLTALTVWLYQNLAQPMVVDADGLNALAQLPDALGSPGGPRILTPHPGEFSRLIGESTRMVQENRAQFAASFAQRHNLVLVLKGRGTVVTDGRRAVLNPTGNPGMATGGSGDVLTGLLTALLAQGMPPFDAARLGVYVHGLAGDLAAAELGQLSLIASDLVDYLPKAFRQCDASGNTN